jgi:hypothetical protein
MGGVADSDFEVRFIGRPMGETNGENPRVEQQALTSSQRSVRARCGE